MSARVEHDMVHVVLAKDGMADMDSRRRDGVLRDIRRHLCPDLSTAELELVEMVHPREIDASGRDGQVEYYQNVETC